MRQLAYLGVAALTAVALLGTSCSSDEGDDTNNSVGGAAGTGGAQGTSTGGKSSTATTIANTGGATSTSTTGATGGATGVGGVTGAGGANVGGVTGAGGNTGAGGSATGGGSSIPLTGGLEIDSDGFYKNGDFQGAIWVTSDTENAKRTDVAHTTLTRSSDDEMCVTGFAPKIPLKAEPANDKDYDYSEVWGADLGWNLNQIAGVDGGEAGAQNPADFTDVTSVTVNVEGATGLNMRVQLETKDSAGEPAYFCATLPLTNLPATVEINTLKTNCWQAGGTTFDPATMQPVSFALAIVTHATKEYPINFCVTELKFNKTVDGG